MVQRLGDEHDVLEIDGERLFDYESVYFDTQGLRCFRDHIEDRRPRFKTRTRCYVTTNDCFFEVKVKDEDDETIKRNVDHEPDERYSLEPAARELIAEVLPECGLEEPDEELQPLLVTAFQRVTVVAHDRPERTTFDFKVTLGQPGGDEARLDERYAIVETKTETGEGAWDRAFAEAGHEPISLSKYRVGVGLIHAPDEDAGYAAEVKELFEVGAASR
jgi:hypothetical protein